MVRRRQILASGAMAVLAIGFMLMIVSRPSASNSNLSNGEFPDDWFAPVPEDEFPAQKALIGKPMPKLELSEWHNGEVNSEDLKGKVVLIDFWATWCAPCIASFPDNNQLYSRCKPKGVEFIGVCTNSGQESFGTIIASGKPEYPVARDANENTMKAWSAQTYPLYAAVDRRGIVRAIGLKHEYLEKVMDRLAAEPALGG